MNKFLLSLIATILLQFSMTSATFAGIPIQENSPAKTTTTHPVAANKQTAQKAAKKSLVSKVLSKLAPASETKTLAIILGILVPFLGVAVWQDAITKDFWITLGLTLLFIIPGIIYALTIILNDSR